MSERFDAIVLAGGAGTRLGGVDKAVIRLGGTTLLDRILSTLGRATTIVCVGPERPTSVAVRWTREKPPGGGPVAALAAALPLIAADVVVILSVDAAFMTDAVVNQLVDTCRDDGVVLVDAGGRRQPLIAAYRTGFLRGRIQSFEQTEGVAMHDVIKPARLVLLDDPSAGRDVDTIAELEGARRELGD